MTCEWLQHISGHITKVKKKERGYKESTAIRELRKEAKRANDARTSSRDVEDNLGNAQAGEERI